MAQPRTGIYLNFNARNHCLKKSPAIPHHGLFSLAVVPQFQLSTIFHRPLLFLQTTYSIFFFKVQPLTPGRKFQIAVILIIREFIPTKQSWCLCSHAQVDPPKLLKVLNLIYKYSCNTPSRCCPFLSIYYKSWNRVALKYSKLSMVEGYFTS